MSRLVRWDPFREVMTIRNQMDRLVDDWFDLPSGWEREGSGLMRLALDVSEDEDNFVIKASVPGIDPDDLDITLSDNTLTIKGEFKADETKESEKYHLRERRYGQFMRSVSLPVAVDADKIEATHEQGILTLTLPKAEEVKPRKISIKGDGKVIEAA